MPSPGARQTAARIAQHVRQAIAAAAANQKPFAHLVVDDFLPTEVFAEVIAALPGLPAYERPERSSADHAARRERAIFALSARLPSKTPNGALDAFGAINQALLSTEVMNACLAPFNGLALQSPNSGTGNGPRSQVILSRDYPPYAIGPHTDIPKRLASMILYLGPDGAPDEWGTSLFVPKQPGFTCARGQHYDFDGFTPNMTVAFRANRALLFARSDRSFHGLLPIEPAEGPRETLLYEIVR